MKISIASAIITALAAAPEALALGINCRGSANCDHQLGGANYLETLKNYVNQAQDGRVYRNGEHIACISRGSLANGFKGGYCVFPQGTASGVTGARAKKLMQDLRDHGCTRCGSVPIDFKWPTSNDPKNGILTSNFVSDTDNPCNTGLC
ncbi:killer toxin [Cercophora newfieldiana]|uniref:Killer toxin n=1 Tax=Cercophora newfieldiana TaxID=92897 RepID=A0AA40CJJ6_9PEZI|nr:killer toxin [Cercophora newfieldiana]